MTSSSAKRGKTKEAKVSEIAPNVAAAYRETIYTVRHAPPFRLVLDQASPEIAALYKQSRTDCCAFITACNPHSQKLDDADNAQKQAGLEKELKRRGLAFIPGVGHDSKGNWPEEPSYLVSGLSLEAAKKLGRQYEQNAIVWCGADEVPRLVLLR